MNSKKLIAGSTALILVFLSLFPCVAFAAERYAVGDVNNDNAVNATDARLALRAAVDLEKLSGPAFNAADVTFDGKVTAEDARLILRAAVDLEVLVDRLSAAEVNSTLNKIKSGAAHTVTNFSKTTTDVKDVSISGALLLPFKKDLEKELKALNGDEYSKMLDKAVLTDNNLPVFGKNYVSIIDDADIKLATKEVISGVDFVASLPDSYNTTVRVRDPETNTIIDKVITTDLSAVKNTVFPAKVNKITVVLNNIKYSEIIKSDAKLGIEKIYDDNYKNSLKTTMDQFDMTSAVQVDGADGLIKSSVDAVSGLSVTYYEDAETGAPLAMRYGLAMDLSQSFTLLNALSGKVSCKFSIYADDYYFFDIK